MLSVNDEIWHKKKQKLTEEAVSLERQIEGVQLKLNGIREKLAFMQEMVAEASPLLFPDSKPPHIQLPHRRIPPPPSGKFRVSMSIPTLAIATKKAAETLLNFTKRQAVEQIEKDFPLLKFNPKSLDRVLKAMIEAGELILLPKSADQGAGHVYAYHDLAAKKAAS